jgi:hypothetical protein
MQDFIVVQQGSPSDLYHGFEGGTVLLMREVIELSTRWHGTAVNDYENSRIHGWLNNEFLSTINENIRNQVRQVRIPYRFGSATTPEPNDTVLIGLNGLQCRVFLLSAREVGADIEVAGFPADGTVLTHFAGLNHNIGEPRREATSAGGVRALWGLRSPHTTLITDAAFINRLRKRIGKLIKCGIIDKKDNFSAYNLRHTYITELMKQGFTSSQVALLVGNSAEITDRTYNHSTSRDVMEKLRER